MAARMSRLAALVTALVAVPLAAQPPLAASPVPEGPGASAAVPEASCAPAPPGAQRIEQAPLQVHWVVQPAPISVSQPFSLRLGLCPARAELLRVDARMPEHRHGMNYRVRLLREGVEWQAQGLVWHMPGRWELMLLVRLDGVEHRLTQSVTLR